jgi:hypothetical protein
MILLTLIAWRFLIFRLVKANFLEYAKALIPNFKRVYKLVMKELNRNKTGG